MGRKAGYRNPDPALCLREGVREVLQDARPLRRIARRANIRLWPSTYAVATLLQAARDALREVKEWPAPLDPAILRLSLTVFSDLPSLAAWNAPPGSGQPSP